MMSDAISVLLVEDDALAQMVAKNFLKDLSCRVDTASSGEEAVKNANQNKYDLILMDIGLGDTDGFTVTAEIKANSSLNKDTPIVAVTANASQEYQQRGIEVGMMDFFAKPLQVAKLKQLLDSIAIASHENRSFSSKIK